MHLDERLRFFLENIILKIKWIIGRWFFKNRKLKICVLIFWTLWILSTANLPQNQGFPLHQALALYVGGYFIFYFICIIISLFFNHSSKEFQNICSPSYPFNMQQVDAMSGVDFENFCVNVLRKNGYRNIKQTKATGDQGVDIIAEKDNIKYAIQCKRYRTPVGNHSVMEVSSGRIYYGCDIGVVMTNSTFTPQAIEHAKRTGILLWNREILQKMLR